MFTNIITSSKTCQTSFEATGKLKLKKKKHIFHKETTQHTEVKKDKINS